MKYVQNSSVALGSGRRPIAMRTMVASALVLALAGCRSNWDHGRAAAWQPSPPLSVAEAHPITVDKEMTDLELGIVRGHGLNQAQVGQVHNFIGLYRHEGTGQFLIGSPGGGANAAVADIRHILREVGIPASAIRVMHVGGGQRIVKLSFLRYVATGPDCGRFSTNLAENKTNQNHENFGCAQQHNLAAMIANPRDLITPRVSDTERDGTRRANVFDKWLDGKSTTAEQSSQEKAGNISDVAKN